MFLGFCVEDPVRYQLLFQRTIPGFEPSPQSYALAVEALDHGRRALADCGIAGGRALDTWTALIAGLAAQQISNEPGSDRWVRLLDEVIDMFLIRRPRRADHRRRGRGLGTTTRPAVHAHAHRTRWRLVPCR